MEKLKINFVSVYMVWENILKSFFSIQRKNWNILSSDVNQTEAVEEGYFTLLSLKPLQVYLIYQEQVFKLLIFTRKPKPAKTQWNENDQKNVLLSTSFFLSIVFYNISTGTSRRFLHQVCFCCCTNNVVWASATMLCEIQQQRI